MKHLPSKSSRAASTLLIILVSVLAACVQDTPTSTEETTTTPTLEIAFPLAMRVGETIHLSAVVTGAIYSDVLWTSSNPSILDVSSDGVMTGVAIGTARIIATTAADTSVHVSAMVSVSAVPLMTLHIAPDSLILHTGAAASLTLSGRDSANAVANVEAAVWQSSDAAGITASPVTGSASVVTGLRPGRYEVNASLDGIVAKIAVIIVAPPAAPTVATGTAHLLPGAVPGMRSLEVAGSVVSNGSTTRAWYEWWFTGSPGQYFSSPIQNAGDSRTAVPLTAVLTASFSSTSRDTIAFRLVAQNEIGSTSGDTGRIYNIPPEPGILSARFDSTTLAVLLTWTAPPGVHTEVYRRAVGATDTAFHPVVLTSAGADSSFDVTVARTYEYYLDVCDGLCTRSAPVTVQTTPFMAPTFLSGVNDSVNGVVLTWTPAPRGATGLMVYRRVDGQSASVRIAELPESATGYTDDSVVPGVTYDYWLVASSPRGTSVPSESMQIAIPAIVPGEPPPSLPTIVSTGFDVSRVYLRPVSLVWDGYQLTFNGSVNPNGSSTKVWFKRWNQGEAPFTGAAIDLGSGTEPVDFTYPGFNPWYNTEPMFFQIVAETAAGIVEGPVSTTAPPAPPTLFLSHDPASYDFSLSWNAVPGTHTYYAIFRKRLGTDPEFIGSLEKQPYLTLQMPPHVTERFDDIRVAATIEYFVRACNDLCANSNIVSVTSTPFLPPAAVHVTTATDRSITLGWTDTNANETGFEVYRRPANTPIGSRIGTTAGNVTTYTDTTAQPAAQYVYWLVAVVGSATSAPSDSVAVTVPGVAAPVPPTIVAARYTITGRTGISSLALSFTADVKSNGYATHGYFLYWTEGDVVKGSGQHVFGDGLAPVSYTWFIGPNPDFTTAVYFKFVAQSAGGTVETPTDSIVLRAPLPPQLSAEHEDSSYTVRLVWPPVPGTTVYYQLFKKTVGVDANFIASGAEFSSLPNPESPSLTRTFPDIRTATTTEWYLRVCIQLCAVSNTVAVTSTPFLPPSNLHVVTISEHNITIGWTDTNLNTSGFEIIRQRSNFVGWTQIASVQASQLAFSDTTAATGNSYTYRVRARFNADTSRSSIPVDATEPGVALAPTVVISSPAALVYRDGVPKVSLEATVNPNGSGAVAWLEYWYDARYQLPTKDIGHGTVPVAITAEIAIPSLDIAGLYYRVVALSPGGRINSDTMYFPLVRPPAIVGAAATFDSVAQIIRISWVNPPGGEGLATRIYRSTIEGPTSSLDEVTLANGASGYVDASTMMQKPGVHRYRITRCSAVTGKCIQDEVVGTSWPLRAPTIQSAVSSAPGYVNVRWTDNSTNANTYVLTRRVGATVFSAHLGGAAEATLLLGAGEWEIAVQSRYAGYNGPMSAILTVTIQ